MRSVNKYIRTNTTDEFFRIFGTNLQIFNWDFLVDKYNKQYNERKEKEFRLDVYVRSLMNYHRIEAIRKIQKENPYLKIGSFRFNSERYFSEGGMDRYCFVYERDKWRRIISLSYSDNLISVSGVPTMINFWYKEFPSMRDERADIFLELFKERIAYGIITTEDNLTGRANYFEDRGGVVLPLLITKDELKNKVKVVCNSHGLKIRDK